MKAEKYLIQNISIKSGDVVLIDIVRADGGQIFDFQAGQYAMLSLREENGKLTEEHPFSIASSPSQKKSLQFGIKIIGRFTQRLANLKAGDEIFVWGPFGNFVFNPENHKDAVFIAGGVGITPFMSAFRYAFDNDLTNKLTLLYSARTINSALFFEEIKQLESGNINFKAQFAITDEDVPASILNAKKCFIDLKMIWAAVDFDISRKDFFVCGPPAFMTAIKNCLKSMGVDDDKIHTEKFSMLLSLRESVEDRGFKFIFRWAAVFFAILVAVVFYDEKKKDEIAAELATDKKAFLEEAATFKTEVPVPAQTQPQTQQLAPVTQPQTSTPPQQEQQVTTPAPTQQKPSKKIITPRTTLS